MAINEIVVHEHKVRMGDNGSAGHMEWDAHIRQVVPSLLPIDTRKFEVFNLRGEFADFQAGSENRTIIFGNGAQRPEGRSDGNKIPAQVKFGEHVLLVNLLSASDKNEGIDIADDNGNVIAQYNKRWNELYIHFNIFGKFDAFGKEAFKYILVKWYELYWKIKDLEDSWLHTSDKSALTARFEKRFRDAAERQIRDDRRKAEDYASRIETYKREINNYYTNMIRLRNSVELEEANIANVGTKLQKELDLIVANPKVSDLHIKNGIFNIYVPKVYIYDDRDNRYYGGNYRVQIKLEEADVRFFGDNPRQGFWTSTDPHPHVNGSSGVACLGSVAGTIAELSSRNELYALALTAIDFLEAANTQDPAGRRVTNWDRVDEEGNIISPAEIEDECDDWCCDHCGEGQSDADDSYRVFESYEGPANGEGDWGAERYVCVDCQENHYSWRDELDEYVRDGECMFDDEDEEDEE